MKSLEINQIYYGFQLKKCEKLGDISATGFLFPLKRRLTTTAVRHTFWNILYCAAHENIRQKIHSTNWQKDL